jgi:hypothetical protein
VRDVLLGARVLTVEVQPAASSSAAGTGVNHRCSAMECGSLSQPAAWSLGTTSFRQVSASVGIVRRREDSFSASTRLALPVKRSSCASVGQVY